VRIKVVAANLTKRQLDYEWVIASGLKEQQKALGGNEETKQPMERKPAPSRSKYIPAKKKGGRK
jgi:ribonuclease R